MSEQAVDNGTPRNDRKVREGLVVSDKMDKTVVVSVEDRVHQGRQRRTNHRIGRTCIAVGPSARSRVHRRCLLRRR